MTKIWLPNQNSFKYSTYLSVIFISFLTLFANPQAPISFASACLPQETISEEVNLLRNIGTFDKWINVANINLPFHTYHPQGIVKIGNTFFLTAINGSAAAYIIKFTLDNPSPAPNTDPNDLSSKIASLINQVQLIDPAFKDRVHPGGIDYDHYTNRIWCPLANKAPDSWASILKINPDDLSYDHVGYIMDHLGTTIVDVENNRIRMIDYHTGMYSFQLNPDRTFPSNIHTAGKFILPNERIEYQDCKHIGQRYALCGGTGPHRVDLIHFSSDVDGNTATSYTIEKRFPLGTTGLSHEAMTFEFLKDVLGRKFVRFYFKPDDGNNTTLKIYDAYKPDPSYTISGRIENKTNPFEQVSGLMVELWTSDAGTLLRR